MNEIENQSSYFVRRDFLMAQFYLRFLVPQFFIF